MKRLYLTILAVYVATTCAALSQVQPPVMFVEPPDGDEQAKKEPLAINAVKVNTVVLGNIAETEMTITFFNPHKRDLAGDFYFPLPEGATVNGYALDVNGVLVDGVVVTKRKAREVFEAEVRKGIDPGIVEWTKGNNYKTRVFPIPANGTRTIRVRFANDVIQKNGESIYQIPLNFTKKLKSFSVRVEVIKSEVSPEITSSGISNLKFKAWNDSFVAEATMKDTAPSEDIIVSLPLVKKKTLIQLASDGQYYFVISDTVKKPARQSTTAPATVRVVWDASGSRAKANHEKEIALLRAFFAKHKAHKISAELVFLRNEVGKIQRFTISRGNVDDLVEAIDACGYDGGSQLGALSERPGATTLPDYYLLFTDGMSNFGDEDPEVLSRPVYAFSSSAVANHTFLKYLAVRTGGAYFNLRQLSEKEILPNIGSSPMVISDIKVEKGSADGVCPGQGEAIYHAATIVGKLTAKEAQINARLGILGKKAPRTSYYVTRREATKGDLLRRYWAQKCINELMVFPKKNEEAITSLGKEHSLVTPGTSLIVLESVDQYVEHRITPPFSLSEMRKEYLAQTKNMDKENKKKEQTKLTRIVKLWEARVEWWEKQFKYPKNFKVPQTRDRVHAEHDASGLMDGVGGDVAYEMSPASRPSMVTMSASLAAPEPEELCEDSVGGGFGAAAGRHGGVRRASGRLEDPTIALKPRDPKAPYITALKQTKEDGLVEEYMQQRDEHGTSAAFFLDCADFFLGKEERAMAIRVLSNIAELETESPALLRILGRRLMQIEEIDKSVAAFEEILLMRPEEPQSYRDLALALELEGEYLRAAKLLYRVAMDEWARFNEIEVIALMELNRLIPKLSKEELKELDIDSRLIKLLDVDVRIVMSWDADLTDIDLWVTEPSGEKAYYSNPNTKIGGHVSRDFTQGYGPEEYCLRRTMKGEYKVQANYYGSSSASLLGPITLQLDIYTDYARPNEKHRSITLRLKDASEVVDVGNIEF